MRGLSVLLLVLAAAVPSSLAAERCAGKFSSLDVYCGRLTGQACRDDALCRVADGVAADNENDFEDALWQLRRRSLAGRQLSGTGGTGSCVAPTFSASTTSRAAIKAGVSSTLAFTFNKDAYVKTWTFMGSDLSTPAKAANTGARGDKKVITIDVTGPIGGSAVTFTLVAVDKDGASCSVTVTQATSGVVAPAWDTTAPTVSSNSATPIIAKKGVSQSFAITFGESVKVTKAVVDTAGLSGLSWPVTVSPTIASGAFQTTVTVTWTVPAGLAMQNQGKPWAVPFDIVVEDAAGNTFSAVPGATGVNAGQSPQVDTGIDVSAATAVTVSPPSGNLYKAGDSFQLKITFQEAVTGSAGLVNGATATLASSNGNKDVTLTATITDSMATGDIAWSLTVTETAATAQTANVNQGLVTVTPKPEHISEGGLARSGSASESITTVTLTFTVPTTGVTATTISAAAVKTAGGAASAPTIATPVSSNGNKVWTFKVTMTEFVDSSITVTYADAGVSPKTKNPVPNLVFSYTPPTVTITSATSGDIAAGTGKITFTATFSEAVSGVAADDFQILGGSATNFLAPSSTVYTVDVAVPQISKYHAECTINAGATDSPKQNAVSNTEKVDTSCNTCTGTTEYYQAPSGKVTLTTLEPGAGSVGSWTYSNTAKPTGAATPTITDKGNSADIDAGLAPGAWTFKAVKGSVEMFFDIRVMDVKTFTVAPTGNSKTLAEGMQDGTNPIVVLTGGNSKLTWTTTEVPATSAVQLFMCVSGVCGTSIPLAGVQASAGEATIPVLPVVVPANANYQVQLRFATPTAKNTVNSLTLAHKTSPTFHVKSGYAGVTGTLGKCTEDCLPGRAMRNVTCGPITGFTPDAAGITTPAPDNYCWASGSKPATEVACVEGALTAPGSAPKCTPSPRLYYAAPTGDVVLDTGRKDAGASYTFTTLMKPTGVTTNPTFTVVGGKGSIIGATLGNGDWQFQASASAYGVVGAYNAIFNVTVMQLSGVTVVPNGKAVTDNLGFVQGGGAKVTWSSSGVPSTATIQARFFDAAAGGKEFDTNLNLFAGAKTTDANKATGVIFSLPSRAPVGNYHITLQVAGIPTVNADSVTGERREAAKSDSMALATGYTQNVGAFGACKSAAGCGPGKQSRVVTCDGKLDGVIVPDSFCWPTGSQKPALEQACALGACTKPFWKTGEYSACTKECGWGRATRTVECRKADDSGTAPDTECVAATGQPKPDVEKVCNAFKCETYEWYTGVYGRCDLPCADGSQVSRQRRSVGCRSQQTLAARPADKCTTAKPDEFKACVVPSCITPYWVLGEWTGCSVDCGGGTATRSVQCKKKNSINDATASDQADSVCVNGGVPKPLASRVCNTAPCAVLASSPWTECTATCGGGKRTRTLKCFEYATVGTQVVATEKALSVCEAFIAPAKLPDTTADCNTQRCPVLNNCDIKGLCNDAGTANKCDSSKKDTVDGSDGACTCDTANWEGRYCEQSKGCNAGAILDSAGECCDSGVVDPTTGVCCGPVAALDSAGQCCRSGKVDGCGNCDGDGAFIDPSGYCCSVNVADAGGLCCEGASRGVAGNVDGCGVCNGLDECNFQATMEIEVDANTDTETLQADYAAALFASLALPSDWEVVVKFEAVPARRALLELLRSVRALAGVKYQMVADIIPGASSAPPPGLDSIIAEQATQVSVPGLNVTSAPVVARQAVCKNGLCEVGERCTATNEATCCVDDCPYKQLNCPTKEGSAETCTGHGRCDENTGTCECFTAQGYAGADCSGCGEGFISVGGTCRYLVIRGFTVSRETLVKAGWAVVMGLVLCLFVGVVAFWCKENKAAAKGPAQDTRSGAVELTTRRQDWV